MKDGPTTYTTTMTTCHGCRHLDHRMVQSGISPIYESRCNHPAIIAEDKVVVVPRFTQRGRYISEDSPMTPRWCPFLSPKETP